MIELITRQSVFENYKTITSKIVKIQNSMFDVDPLFEDGDNGQWYADMHDAINIPTDNIKNYYSILSFDHSDINTFTAALTDKLWKLLTKINVSDLIIIGHIKSNLIGNLKNKYRPFQKATKKFESIAKDLNYEEAFKINLTDLNPLIEIVFWITRCDARCPEYIYFSDVNETISFYLCKSGGIHVIEHHKETVSRDIVESLDMHFVDGYCEEKFSITSKIGGRQSGRNPIKHS